MNRTRISSFTSRRSFLKSTATLAAAAGLSPLASGARAAQGSPRPGLKLGLASYTTRELSLEDTIAVVKRLDLHHLCLKEMHLPLTLSPDEIRKRAKTVRDAGIDLYGGGVIYMRKASDIEPAFRYAQAAGMRTIVGVAAPDLLDRVEAGIRKYNIRVAIHNHGPGDKVYPTPQDVLDRVKNRDPRLGLCIDVGHTLRSGMDPAEAVLKAGDRVLDVHLKDINEASAKGHSIEMGRGVLDIPAVLRALRQINYPHIVSFEYEQQADNPLPGLAECVGYTRGVLATMD